MFFVTWMKFWYSYEKSGQSVPEISEGWDLTFRPTDMGPVQNNRRSVVKTKFTNVLIKKDHLPNLRRALFHIFKKNRWDLVS